ncbi:hypothetical protein [Haliea sp. E17]|uniref:hypothetical protein n=1 Tax=Haliea sp. E17 TaxID=3401576 RepID=UPI003AAE353F
MSREPASADADAGMYFGYNWRDLAATRVTPFLSVVEGSGLSSIYLRTPEDLYRENIEAAESGDPKSQFQVARALKECLGVSKTDVIQRLEQQNTLPEQFIATMKARAERCDALAVIIGDDLSRWETHYAWLEKAADAGNRDAVVWMASIHPEAFEGSTVRQHIIDAALEAPGTDLAALSQVTSYLAHYSAYEESDYYTWQLALCETRSDICTPDAIRAYIQYYAGDAQLESSESTAQAIRQALAAGNRESLEALIPLADRQPQPPTAPE